MANNGCIDSPSWSKLWNFRCPMQYMPFSTWTRKCLLRPGAFNETEKSPIWKKNTKSKLVYNDLRSLNWFSGTYIRLTIPNQKITIVSMWIEHRITLASCNRSIIPSFSGQIDRAFDLIGVRIVYHRWWWRNGIIHRIIAAIHWVIIRWTSTIRLW